MSINHAHRRLFLVRKAACTHKISDFDVHEVQCTENLQYYKLALEHIATISGNPAPIDISFIQAYTPRYKVIDQRVPVPQTSISS